MTSGEFPTVQQPSFLSVFIMTICLRSRLDAHFLRIPTNREKAAALQDTVLIIGDKIKIIDLE